MGPWYVFELTCGPCVHVNMAMVESFSGTVSGTLIKMASGEKFEVTEKVKDLNARLVADQHEINGTTPF